MADRVLYGVILAAGLSTRAGCFKMELTLGERTIIEHAVAGMCGVVERAVVVGGYRAERIRELLAGYPRVEVVVNERFEAGMFTSVKVGLARVQEVCAGQPQRDGPYVFLLPGDHPLVKKETYRWMLEVPGEVVIPTYRGRKGHPVLMAPLVVDAVLREPDASTLRDVLARVGYVTVEVEDEGVVFDVDDLDDYRNAEKTYGLLTAEAAENAERNEKETEESLRSRRALR